MIKKRKYKRIADDQYKRQAPIITYHQKVKKNINPECVAQMNVQFSANTILDQVELCMNEEGKFYLAAYWHPYDYLTQKVMKGTKIIKPKPEPAKFESNTLYVNPDMY
jgi:hypothetical protein